METHWKILTGLSFIITLFSLMAAFSDQIILPDMKVGTQITSFENDTKVLIIINNDGWEPATGLRITINSEKEIISFRPQYSTEEIELFSTGSQNVIGKMKRLANQQQVQIETILKSEPEQVNAFAVIVNHDKGSVNYNLKKTSTEVTGDRVTSLLISIAVAVIAAFITNFVKRFSHKKNGSKSSSSGSKPPSDDSSSSNTVQQGIIPDLENRLSSVENKVSTLISELGIGAELLSNKKIDVSTDRKAQVNSIINEAQKLTNDLKSKNVSVVPNTKLQVLIASYHFHIDDPERALSNLEDILKKNPMNASAWSNKGVVLSHLERHDDSISSYKKSLEIEPGDVFTLNNLAVELTDKLANYEEALSYLETAIIINPKFPFSYYHKGNALFHLKRYEESLENANEALKITPNDESVLCLKAICLGELKGPEEALKILDESLKINSNYFFALSNKAFTLSQLGRYDEALTFAEKALKIKPNDPQTRKYKQNILKKLNENPKS